MLIMRLREYAFVKSYILQSQQHHGPSAHTVANERCLLDVELVVQCNQIGDHVLVGMLFRVRAFSMIAGVY